MEYELIPIEAKAAGKSHVLMGTIVDTRDCDIKTFSQGDDKWVIRADVEIDGHGLFEGVPVFYHCQLSKTAGRAAFEAVEEGQEDDLITEGSPFVKDDRVVVLNDGEGEGDELLAENLKIVAYEDGLPRQCVFQFRITRDDGTVIDRNTLFSIRIQQEIVDHPGHYQTLAYTTRYVPDDPSDPNWTFSNNVWYYKESGYYLREFSYNTITQIWTVPFMVGPYIVPKNGKDFWVEFACEGSVACQYADKEIDSRGYIYIEDDFFQESHKIVAKFYEIIVPHYEVVSEYVTPTLDICTSGAGRWCWSAGGGLRSATIKSSIPYTVMFKAPVTWAILYPAGFYRGMWVENCLFYPPNCAACQAKANELGDRWCDDQYFMPRDESANVTATCSNGTVSSNLKTNRIWEEQVITPTKNVVQIDEHSMVLSYHGSGLYVLTKECAGGGTIDFPLSFGYFKLDIGIFFSPNT